MGRRFITGDVVEVAESDARARSLPTLEHAELRVIGKARNGRLDPGRIAMARQAASLVGAGDPRTRTAGARRDIPRIRGRGNRWARSRFRLRSRHGRCVSSDPSPPGRDSAHSAHRLPPRIGSWQASQRDAYAACWCDKLPGESGARNPITFPTPTPRSSSAPAPREARSRTARRGWTKRCVRPGVPQLTLRAKGSVPEPGEDVDGGERHQQRGRGNVEEQPLPQHALQAVVGVPARASRSGCSRCP